MVVRHFSTGVKGGGFKALFQGTGNITEYSGYETACDQANEDAYRRMVDHAMHVHADAIIGMHYDTTQLTDGVTAVLAYGTAVKLST